VVHFVWCLSRRYGNSERKRWNPRVTTERPCALVNISWHSPWRHDEGINGPETNVQRRQMPLDHSARSESTDARGHWNDGDCCDCDAMRFAVWDRWGMVWSGRASDDDLGDRRNKWNDGQNKGTETPEWKKIDRRRGYTRLVVTPTDIVEYYTGGGNTRLTKFIILCRVIRVSRRFVYKTYHVITW